ncbi:hypothetical protein GCM10022288_11530 [Gryllotalpicola kribbensis]|uniref:Uncharacterized protein n=1 Tax=Gryllotalpicola kribbensis TaxID=993084 RepID=A0ABP8ANU5_9MICO
MGLAQYELGKNRVTGRQTISVFTPSPSKLWSSKTWALGAGRFAPRDGRPSWTFTLPSRPEWKQRAIARIAAAVAECFNAVLAALDPEADALLPGLCDFYAELRSGRTPIGDDPDDLIERLVARGRVPGLREYSRTWSPERQAWARRAAWAPQLIADLRGKAIVKWAGHRRRSALEGLRHDVRRALLRGARVPFIRLTAPWPRNAPILVATEGNVMAMNAQFADHPGFDEWLDTPIVELRWGNAAGFLRTLVHVADVREVGVLIDGERSRF